MPEHQILAGVALRPWDAADSPGCYDYEIDFCAAGSRVYPLGAECAVIRPEQIMLLQKTIHEQKFRFSYSVYGGDKDIIKTIIESQDLHLRNRKNLLRV